MGNFEEGGKKRRKDEGDVYANAFREASSLGMHIKRSRSGRWRTRDSLGRSLRASCTTPIHSHERVNCRRDVDLRPRSYDPPRWDNERCSKSDGGVLSRGLYYAAKTRPTATDLFHKGRRELPLMFLRFLSLSFHVHVMQFVECNALYATSTLSFIHSIDKTERG